MKILLGYSYFQYDVDIRDMNEAWLARLRAAGIQADGVCLTLNPPGPCLSWNELDERWRKRDSDLLKLYESLAHRAGDYDVFINYNGINLHPEFVPQLPTFNVFSCSDDPENSHNLSRPVAAAYDLCLVANIAALPLYRSWGVKEARFWPLGFRVDDFDPSLTKEKILNGEREVDITMLCERQSHWRKDRLDRFTAAFPDGAYYGPGWPKGFLPESQRVPLLQRARVGLNMHNSTGPINFRTYHLPANGVLQVCDNKSHLGQVFELGKEVAGYDTIEEAVELCRHYLAHEDERRCVAAAGWERARRDYNEVAVFQLVERYVREVKAARAAAPQAGTAPARPAVAVSSGRQPTIFLHTDLIYEPDKWYQRFESLLQQQPAVNHRLVNLLEADITKLFLELQPGDALIGRFGHHPDDLRRIRPIYDQIARVFGGRIFPKFNTYRYYDDKAQQAELLRAKGYPMPATAFVSSLAELEKVVGETGLRFPLVTKQIHGAGSSGVKLAADHSQVPFPCLVQEFCAGNDSDYRLNVIGNRVMGFRRLNRDGDFRASGSGKILYPSDFDGELVQLAYRISRANGFDSMAYDFVKKDGRWVVLELSYAYQDVAVRNCEFYYDMRTGGKVAKHGVYPQDFILADFLKEHYGIETQPSSNVSATAGSSPAQASKPRILLIADVPNWIFERHAHALHRYLGDEFDFTLGYQGQQYNEDDYELIYPLEWNLVPPEQIRSPAKYVTGLRSHFTWADRPFLPFANFLATKFQRVHVVSRRLHEIFRHSLPTAVRLSHGIDTVFFTPTTQADLSGRKLRLGWAGNRKSPVKGFAEFIEPLGRIPGVELVTCGYSDRNLSLEQMKEFYNSIDAYACASEFEGNNNSLMEAAAMARAIVTTDNGTVPEYLRNGESALIVARELPAFIQSVERLRDDPSLRAALGEKARTAALEKWDWRVRAQDYRTLFRAVLNARAQPGLQPVLPPANNPLAIATAYLQRGDYLSARKSLELAAQLTPDSPDLLAALGRVYDELGDTESARRVREKLEKPIMSTQPPVSGYSFCIITNGKRPEKLQREIESIRALNIPQCEIVVGGDIPSGLDQVTLVSLPEAARAGQLGVMRNRLVERAKYDHVIVADDDLLFQPDFYRGLLEFGEDYDVQCVPFLNPDGTRYWDWATSGGPRGHALLPYDQTDPHVYVTGGLCIMKKAVADRVKWDEQLGFYQAEDSEFSSRLHQAGIHIRFNPHSTVVHDDPHHTQVDNFVVGADPIRQMARDAFRQNQFDRACYLVQRLQAVCPNGSITPEQFELDSLVDKREGKYVYLCDEVLEGLAEASGAEKVKRLNRVLRGLGPFYFQCGGAGDALLLMSTFYDKEPGSIIVSYPNSIPALKSLYEAFPALGTVYFLPAHASNEVNAKLRAIISELPTCQGMGATPKDDYAREWNEQLDIFRKYKVDPRPQWARQPLPSDSEKRVTVAPQGSLVGMAGTKRNMIEPGQWEELLRFLQGQGYRPVILGTPNEREDYPCLDGCEDRRSFSFREQMDQIAGSARFVGADSWAKTFAALAGVPTIVFEAIKGRDWRGQKDPSDYVFLDPWECLQVVSGLEALKDVFTRRDGGAQLPGAPTVVTAASTVHVAWEGTFTDNGSLSHVNRELTRTLARQPKVEVTRVGDGKRAQAPARTQVTVRHAWPPNWQRPKHGAWVLIQPWEFGALPTDWLARVADVDEVWTPTEYVRRVYVDSGVAPSKVKVVPNGIDPARFRPDAPPMTLATTKSFRFLFVGGTIHRKGPDLLLQAYLESFTAADDVCLVIKDFGGNDVYAGQTFEARIREAQAQPNAPEILYLTTELSSEQMPGLYAACDCFVLPYRGEGFALPVLEAMGCGLPVVVTAGGATDDFAKDEFAYRISATSHRIGYKVGPFKLTRPAWLLEPSHNELKERMQWVAIHREEARAKGRAASEYARREWTWERAAQMALQRLHEIAARVKDRPAGNVKPFELPAVARIGHLGEAHELFQRKKYREAWEAAIAAMDVRPFHPEARELLKEISKKSPAVGPAPTPLKEPRLTVCLIAKNEEKFIARCLQSVRDVAWQIVVVDTGSTDRTQEIAREYGAQVHEFKWCDDFSAARNAALEYVRGDWVLVLDADEELTAEGREVLRQEMCVNNVMAYRLSMVDVGKEDEGCSYVPRLFRNAPALFYVGRIHEQVFTSIEVRRQEWGLENRFSKATLLHHGYTAEMTQNRGKNARNLRLLELAVEEMPNEPNLLMNYGLELVRAGQLELGLEQYIGAFRVLQSLPDERIVPELRESLLTQLCTHLMMARKFEEVVTVANTPLARKHGGLTASLHFAQGLALMELKTHREAAEQFRQCLAKRDQAALTPMNRDIRKAGPHHCLATCLMQLREFENAAEAFQQALAADPQSRAVRFDYAAFLAVRGLPVEALKQLHALVAEKSDELSVWLLGGQIALSQPQFSEFAYDWTGEGIKHFPQDRMLALQRAEALLLCERAAEALPLWRQAGASGAATPRAAQIVCELVAGGPVTAVATSDEPAVSREFLKWYRRLVRWGASGTVLKLNENVQVLRNALPTAVATLEAALSEARQPVAV